MRMQLPWSAVVVCWIALVLTTTIAPCRADDSVTVLPKSLYGGDPVTLSGNALKAEQLTLTFCQLDARNACQSSTSYTICQGDACDVAHQPTMVKLLDASGMIVIAAPRDLPPGTYSLAVSSGQTSLKVNGAAKITILAGADSFVFVPYIAAVVVVLGFGVLVTALVRSIKPLPPGDGLSWVGRLLLDPRSNTFSLSLIQFYIWTAVGVAAWIYFACSRNVVQGIATFEGPPGTLPLVYLGSAATAVAAAGVSSATGGKGSGEFKPGWGDLITSGGVVAPERVQFLVWTVLAAAGFLLYTFITHTPQTIVALPDLPKGFNYLMGASALGYVGGKIARGPGPQIRQAIATRGGGVVALTVTGSYLGTTGATYTLAANAGPQVPLILPPGAATGPDVATTGYASQLAFSVAETSLTTPVQPGARPTLTFTIVNPDGEKAVWQFEEGAPVLHAIGGVLAQDMLHLTIFGANLETVAQPLPAGAARPSYFLTDTALANAQAVQLTAAGVAPQAGSEVNAAGIATRLVLAVPNTGPLTFVAPAAVGPASRRLTFRIVNRDGSSASRDFVV